MALAFEGLRVLEFAQVISGPMSVSLLSFLGAEVIKIETPGQGDQGRRMMDIGPNAGQNKSPLYQGLNTGKRSLALNLKHQDAKTVVHRLVEKADVVVENLRPGVMANLGFGYEDLKAVRPDIIYCSISGYGQTGPKKDAAAYDGTIQGASGIMTVNGTEDTGPLRVGFPVIDATTALTAAFAVSSAVYRRSQTGEGQYLDVSMLDSALSLMSPTVNTYLITGTEPTQLGNLSVTRQPTADVFAVADGFIQVTALTLPQTQALWGALERPDLADDPRTATIQDQVESRPWIRAEIARTLSDRAAQEWVSKLAAANIPCAVVRSIRETIEDDQLDHRDVVAKVESTGHEDGHMSVVNVGFRAVPDSPRVTTPAPDVGQHTAEILTEIGFTSDEVADLRDSGVV